MRTIKNQHFEIKGEAFDYKRLIMECLNAKPENGFDFKELKLRLRIEAVVNDLEAPGDDMIFEDADYRELKRIVMAMRWGIRDENIFKFISLFE
jgi:hypothetical protein